MKSAGKASKSSGAGFSEALDKAAGGVSNISGAVPTQAVDALLSIQEVDDAVESQVLHPARGGESAADAETHSLAASGRPQRDF